MWPIAACGALLAAAAALAYGRTFSVPMLFDDGPAIVENASIRHLGTAFWPPGGSTVSGRPVLNLSLALNYAVSGTDVRGATTPPTCSELHASGWPWRSSGSCGRTLASRPGTAGTAAPSPLQSPCFGRSIPCSPSRSRHIVQRAESLMGLFYLLTLYAFIRGADAAGGKARTWFALSIGACLLGMGTKEVMASAPPDRPSLRPDVCRGKLPGGVEAQGKGPCRPFATWYCSSARARGARPRRIRRTVKRRPGGGATGSTQSAAIIHYLRLCVWPHPLIFDYAARPSPRSPCGFSPTCSRSRSSCSQWRALVQEAGARFPRSLLLRDPRPQFQRDPGGHGDRRRAPDVPAPDSGPRSQRLRDP